MDYNVIKSWGIGAIIAIIVLVLCVVFWAIGKSIEPAMILLLIGLLALARLT